MKDMLESQLRLYYSGLFKQVTQPSRTREGTDREERARSVDGREAESLTKPSIIRPFGIEFPDAAALIRDSTSHSGTASVLDFPFVLAASIWGGRHRPHHEDNVGRLSREDSSVTVRHPPKLLNLETFLFPSSPPLRSTTTPWTYPPLPPNVWRALCTVSQCLKRDLTKNCRELLNDLCLPPLHFSLSARTGDSVFRSPRQPHFSATSRSQAYRLNGPNFSFSLYVRNPGG